MNELGIQLFKQKAQVGENVTISILNEGSYKGNIVSFDNDSVTIEFTFLSAKRTKTINYKTIYWHSLESKPL